MFETYVMYLGLGVGTIGCVAAIVWGIDFILGRIVGFQAVVRWHAAWKREQERKNLE